MHCTAEPESISDPTTQPARLLLPRHLQFSLDLHPHPLLQADPIPMRHTAEPESISDPTTQPARLRLPRHLQYSLDLHLPPSPSKANPRQTDPILMCRIPKPESISDAMQAVHMHLTARPLTHAAHQHLFSTIAKYDPVRLLRTGTPSSSTHSGLFRVVR